MEQNLIPVLVRAHGTLNQNGTPFQGKASPAYNVPDKYKDDDHLVFREAESSEQLIDEIERELSLKKWISERVIPDNDMHDFPLLWQKEKVNQINSKWVSAGKNILTLAVHHNAQGWGDEWGNAIGICVFTSPGQTASDRPAGRLAAAFMKDFPDWKVRVDTSDGDADFESPFTILMANGMAILIELGFQDTRSEVEKLKNPEFRKRIVNTIVNWFDNEIKIAI